MRKFFLNLLAWVWALLSVACYHFGWKRLEEFFWNKNQNVEEKLNEDYPDLS